MLCMYREIDAFFLIDLAQKYVDLPLQNRDLYMTTEQINTIVFDIDGTLLDTEHSIIGSLQETLEQIIGKKFPHKELAFALGIPGEVALKQLGMTNVEKASKLWTSIYEEKYKGAISLFRGIPELLGELKRKGYTLGIITSKTREEYMSEFIAFGVAHLFDTVICMEDAAKPKPSSEPMREFLKRTNKTAEEVLYIGDTKYDMLCAQGAEVAFGLAVWGCYDLEGLQADFYFNDPKDILYQLAKPEDVNPEQQWLNWAQELQFIAQAGLTYTKDDFDRDRFARLREISAEIMSARSGLTLDLVKDLFCNEEGFQTPKLDTRAAIFKEDKILLVKERDGRWSLPGGWVDLNESIRTNTVKEVWEEAGLRVVATKLIAVQDRNLHNSPRYAYGVTKAFVECEVIDGTFKENIETVRSDYFALDSIPPLSEDKNSMAQIELCFKARESKSWQTLFD